MGSVDAFATTTITSTVAPTTGGEEVLAVLTMSNAESLLIPARGNANAPAQPMRQR
ncbi:MAG: hypothetical protein SOI38_00800 [Eggerthellaceae bacterium]|jgi:hypothetical protein